MRRLPAIAAILMAAGMALAAGVEPAGASPWLSHPAALACGALALLPTGWAATPVESVRLAGNCSAAGAIHLQVIARTFSHPPVEDILSGTREIAQGSFDIPVLLDDRADPNPATNNTIEIVLEWDGPAGAIELIKPPHILGTSQ